MRTRILVFALLVIASLSPRETIAQLGCNNTLLWDILDSTASYHSLNLSDVSSTAQTQMNQQGQQGFRYRVPFYFSSGSADIFWKLNSSSATYQHNLAPTATTRSALLAQLNNAGANGYMFITLLWFTGDTSSQNLLVKKIGSASTYGYRLLSETDTSTEFASQVNQQGTEGYMWLAPLVIGAGFQSYNLYVTDFSSKRYDCRLITSTGNQTTLMNQQGASGYLYVTPLSFNGHNVDLYLRDKTSSKTYLYASAPIQSSAASALSQYNQMGSQKYLYLTSLVANNYYVRLGSGGGDDYEPDGTRSTAKRISNGQTQRRSINAAGDTDIVKIIIGSAGARNIWLETSGTSGDTQMWLLNANGTRLAYNDDGGVGDFSQIKRSYLPRGTYYMKIREYGNNGRIAAYKLKAIWTTP